MAALGTGVLPGTNLAQAADIVMGELGNFPHIPQLPERGLGADSVARTLSMVDELSIDRGPRGWVLSPRPQIASRRMRDLLVRDLDTVQDVWGENVPHVKVQAMGPWSLAASIELPNGHKVLSDSGAFRDLCAALHEAIVEHSRDVAKRFNAEVAVQLDEPLLAEVVAGKIAGTTDFDVIPAVNQEVVLEVLEAFDADYLHTAPLWEAARSCGTLLTKFAGLDTARHLDGLGEHFSAGNRVGFGLDRTRFSDSRAAAIAVAHHFDRMGLSRDFLVNHVDVYPDPITAPARDYRFVAEIADMLQRDAGDL